MAEKIPNFVKKYRSSDLRTKRKKNVYQSTPKSNCWKLTKENLKSHHRHIVYSGTKRLSLTSHQKKYKLEIFQLHL